MSVREELLLETARLSLRPVAAVDADELWSAIWSDPDVTRYLPPRRPLPKDRMPGYLERVSAHWRDHDVGVWAVREKDGGRLLGHCGLVINEPPDVELIYALAKPAWGQGFATEAAGRVTTFAFERRSIDELLALVFPENTTSSRVLEKLGFVVKGRVERWDSELLLYARRKP